MPDFFEGSPADISWYPPTTDEHKEKLGNFFSTKAAPPKTLSKIPDVVAEGNKLAPGGNFQSWSILGFCWGRQDCCPCLRHGQQALQGRRAMPPGYGRCQRCQGGEHSNGDARFRRRTCAGRQGFRSEFEGAKARGRLSRIRSTAGWLLGRTWRTLRCARSMSVDTRLFLNSSTNTRKKAMDTESFIMMNLERVNEGYNPN